MNEVKCHCGSTASLRSNSLIYNGKEYGNGKAWICDRFPECRGSIGTHPDGRPLGTIPDEETKKLRIQVHALMDPLWKSKKIKRNSMYYKLGKALRKQAFHTGECNAEECRAVLELIPKLFAKELSHEEKTS